MESLSISPTQERLSRGNPGPLASYGTVRGTFISMLERFPLEEVRAFWKALPILQEGRFLPEAEGYRFIWEYRSKVHLYYLEEVNEALMEFLLHHGQSQHDFFDERHFRFEHGGVWSSRENLEWIKDTLPTFYTGGDPMATMLRFACEWAMRAVPGANCQIPRFSRAGDRVEAVFSFAPDGTFRYRCPYLFSRSTILGLQMFPRFVGLKAFEETRILADCLHPAQLLRGVEWEIRDGRLFIRGELHGRTIRFSEWSQRQDMEFQGPPIPDRDVLLVEKPFRCPIRRIEALSEGCVYDAPLFLATIRYLADRKSEEPRDYLKSIIEGLSIRNQGGWASLEERFSALLAAAGDRLRFEYRIASQTMVCNGTTLVTGVPAMILRKILAAHMRGQERFDFLTFKHDPGIFFDSKNTSFETRWNRLRGKLAKDAPHMRLEKAGRGEFVLRLERELDFLETP